MENSNEMLTMAMATAGARNGFEDVTAEFSAFRDFKLKWTRSYKWISFEVSDYLRNAPQNVIESLAETIYAKIGGAEKTPYSENVCEYLNSERFLRDNQDLSLKRFRGISQTPCGENVDLTEAYIRLVVSGLVERDPRLVIRWGPSSRSDMRILTMEWTFSERESIASSNSSMSFVVQCLAAQAALLLMFFILVTSWWLSVVTWLQTGRTRSLLSGALEFDF